jgi:hypothetical protein
MTIHRHIDETNKRVASFARDGTQKKPLQQCLRFLLDRRRILDGGRVKGSVEMCYFRQLFVMCEMQNWYLPDVHDAMVRSHAPAALFARLRLALCRSGVSFETKDEVMITNRLKNSKPTDFVVRNGKCKKVSLVPILTFSYFSRQFSLARDCFGRIATMCSEGDIVGANVLASDTCFGALSFVIPIRPSTIGGITTGAVEDMEFDKTNGVCYIDIESVKTGMVRKRAYPRWIGVLFQFVRQTRPKTDSNLLFIRPDGVPYSQRNLRNYIARRWNPGKPTDKYIGGNARRKLMETALAGDAYDRAGTENMVEHSRKVGMRYLLPDSVSALAGLRSYIRGFLSLCQSYQVDPPAEFMEMVGEIKME